MRLRVWIGLLAAVAVIIGGGRSPRSDGLLGDPQGDAVRPEHVVKPLRLEVLRGKAHQVRRTVIHEVAHHFGIDDDRLTELGW